MKRSLRFICMLIAAILVTGCFGCSGGSTTGGGTHTHTYKEVAASEATCEKTGSELYYTCDCGKIFVKKGDTYTETTLDEVTLPEAHDYRKVTKVTETCFETGVKTHYVCRLCGKLFILDGINFVEATEADLVIPNRQHNFNKEVTTDEYRISEATDTEPAKYVKSCVCGTAGDVTKDVFSYGKTLTDYRAEGPDGYIPRSLTMSLYDAENCVYGFTWNEDSRPARPVLEIKKVGVEGDYRTVGARYEALTTYKKSTDNSVVTVNYIKVEIELEPATRYEYRVGDMYLNEYTPYATITTVNPEETGAWRFAHVSDSQVENGEDGDNTGSNFAYVLDYITANDSNRFVIHSGDVVEYSKSENYWTNMLDANREYLSKIPVMAISGNHETTYRNGKKETYKHFNYKTPSQSVDLGFYYSFSYGGVKFIMLNTNELVNDALTLTQYNWLKGELQNKTEKWTVVTMHHPMYSPGKWGSNEEQNGVAISLTKQLAGLFAEYKVDLVLQGHDHMISRTKAMNKDGVTEETKENIDGVEYSIDPQGVIYLENGPAGSQTRTVHADADTSLYEYAENSKIRSWAEIEVNDDTLTVYVKNAATGTAANYHVWGIKKTV